MAEKVDIYDSNYKHLGTKDKKQVHIDGDWHKSFICIVFNPNHKTIYLQKKYPGRYSFNRPDYLDFTVGGHYQANETIEEGIREIKEELGIDVNFSDLISLGIRKKAAKISETFIEKEFQYIYLLPTSLNLNDFPLDGDEVKGITEININNLIKLLEKSLEFINIKTIEINGNKKSIIESKTTLENFVPSYLEDGLYLKFCKQINNYLSGDEIEKWDMSE